MLTGQHFRLLVETLGIETIDGDNRIPVKVPAGETITVLSGPRPGDMRMVDVQWGDKKLELARQQCENARVALEHHRADHNC